MQTNRPTQLKKTVNTPKIDKFDCLYLFNILQTVFEGEKLDQNQHN